MKIVQNFDHHSIVPLNYRKLLPLQTISDNFSQ